MIKRKTCHANIPPQLIVSFSISQIILTYHFATDIIVNFCGSCEDGQVVLISSSVIEDSNLISLIKRIQNDPRHPEK